MTTIWNDHKGNRWDSRIGVAEAMRLKNIGFDILDPNVFEPMLKNTLQQIEVITEVHRTQWEGRNLQYTEFADLMLDGGRFNEVQSAFVAALANFSRSVGKEAMANLIETAFRTVRSMEATANRKLAEGSFQRKIEDFLAKEEAKLEENLNSLGS